jgi:hypothetical protein
MYNYHLNQLTWTIIVEASQYDTTGDVIITAIVLIIVYLAFIITDINFAIILYNQYKMPEYELDNRIAVIVNEDVRPDLPQLGERKVPEEGKKGPQQSYAAIQLNVNSVDNAIRKHEGNYLHLYTIPI